MREAFQGKTSRVFGGTFQKDVYHAYCSLNTNGSRRKSIVIRNIFKVKDEIECFLPKVLKEGIAQAYKIKKKK